MSAIPRTLGDLVELYATWLQAEVAANRRKPRTATYYTYQLGHLTTAIGKDKPLADLIPYDLEKNKTGWHIVQAAQRLFNWGVEMGLVPSSPFARIKRPPLGERERVLDPQELARLLRSSGPALRNILLAERLTIGRPQELRVAQWRHYRTDLQALVMTEFKGKGKTREKVRLRILPVVPRLARLLTRLQRKGVDPDACIFLNTRHRAWTTNSLLLAVRRACERAGLNVEEGEKVVPYTLRHTAATLATANGVRDRLLADLMGHVNTKTTARYQHLQPEHLVAGARIATARNRA